MRYHTDPDSRKYDRSGEWQACPQCRNGMLSLKDYEWQDDEPERSAVAELEYFNDRHISNHTGFSSSPSFRRDISSSGNRFLDWLRNLFAIPQTGKQKLATLKREILPNHPSSLVCVKCLYVLKRPER